MNFYANQDLRTDNLSFPELLDTNLFLLAASSELQCFY